MELDSKDAEIEQLQLKLAALNSETASLSSADNEGIDAFCDLNILTRILKLATYFHIFFFKEMTLTLIMYLRGGYQFPQSKISKDMAGRSNMSWFLAGKSYFTIRKTINKIPTL